MSDAIAGALGGYSVGFIICGLIIDPIFYPGENHWRAMRFYFGVAGVCAILAGLVAVIWP